MNFERYNYIASETCLYFTFISEGPNGKIKKGISFTPQNSNNITYFNLAFGDLDENTAEINDLSISDNKDTEKILSTVAAAVSDFISHFPDMMIYVKGSTPGRTRLYQMKVASNIEQINSLLTIYGFVNGNWEKFASNTDYESFLVANKIV